MWIFVKFWRLKASKSACVGNFVRDLSNGFSCMDMVGLGYKYNPSFNESKYLYPKNDTNDYIQILYSKNYRNVYLNIFWSVFVYVFVIVIANVIFEILEPQPFWKLNWDGSLAGLIAPPSSYQRRHYISPFSSCSCCWQRHKMFHTFQTTPPLLSNCCFSWQPPCCWLTAFSILSFPTPSFLLTILSVATQGCQST